MKFHLTRMMQSPETSAQPFAALLMALISAAAVTSATAALLWSF